MRYLLDTCVISDFIKNEPGTVAKIKQTPPSDIAVSSITVMELRYGLLLNPQRAKNIESVINSFLDAIALPKFALFSSLKGDPSEPMMSSLRLLHFSTI